MYKKIWKEEQLRDFYAPVEVKRRIQELIDVLCFHYGAGRNVDLELGGFIAAFTDCSASDIEQYDRLLQQYHLNEALFEYQETLLIEQSHGLKLIWTETLFLCGSDYAIVIVKPAWQQERR